MNRWNPGEQWRDVWVRVIREALEFFEGNKMRAARELGISIRSLRDWVKESPELQHYKLPQRSSKAARS